MSNQEPSKWAVEAGWKAAQRVACVYGRTLPTEFANQSPQEVICCIEETQQAINQACAQKDQKIAQLKARVEELEMHLEGFVNEHNEACSRLTLLSELLERVPHKTFTTVTGVSWWSAPKPLTMKCEPDCPRCAWQKMKANA